MAYYKCCHIWRLYECHCLPSKIVLALKITDMVLNYLHPPNVSECHTHWYLSSHRHVCQTCGAEFVSSQRPRGYIWLYMAQYLHANSCTKAFECQKNVQRLIPCCRDIVIMLTTDDYSIWFFAFITHTHMHLVSLVKCDYIVMVQITFYSMTYSNNHLFLLPIGQLMENWAKLFRLSKWNNTDRRNTRTQILILRETRDTLPETNIAPENWWLQDEMSSWGGLREGNSLIS